MSNISKILLLTSLLSLLLLTLFHSPFSTYGATSKDRPYFGHGKQQDSSNNINNIAPSQTPIILLIDAIASIYRMFAALGLSFIVAIAVGITAAVKPLASKVIIPIIDILQSVPILGFFPVAIAFFITLFNGSQTGIELAAIFLIFSSMVWNMIFSVYESILLIPSDLQETSRAFRANPLLLLRRLYLPAITPKLIYNSMMSWSGGWYFLTAAEIISLGSRTYTLQGLGSLLGTSVSSGQYPLAFATFGTLITAVLFVDFLFWRPLELFANRFRYEYSSSSINTSTMQRPPIIDLGRLSRVRATFPTTLLTDFLVRNPRRVIIREKSINLIEKVTSSAYGAEQKMFSPIHRWFEYNAKALGQYKKITLAILAGSIVTFIVAENTTISKSLFGLYQMYAELYSNEESKKVVSEIPLGLLLSYLRLTASYLITLAWTIPVAIRIARSHNFSRIMSIIQTFASIPATAFFPFMAILVNYIPGGLEFPSILLILTGMQWYMLFNLIGGVRSISGDIEEAAKAFRCTKTQYLKRVFFPSIYPSFVTGSITAWGGGWNALIVSEYLVYGNKGYSVLGIGSLLDNAAYNLGNTVLILMIVGVMVATIVTINNLAWRRLYRKVLQKYSTSG
jgi:NitT/TauT family transport system permease protein